MKKAILILLVLGLCLCLCACGNEDKKPETQSTMNQTSTDEKQDNNNTENTTTGNETDQTEPQQTTVEITINNWEQYFEIVPYIKSRTNSFDEISTITISSSVKLKEEYKLADGAGSNVNFEIEQQWETRECKVDFTTGSVELGEVIKTESSDTTTTSFTDFVFQIYGDYITTFGCSDQIERGDTDTKAENITTQSFVKMLRAEGTLILCNE